jgi:hypothetical protein
LKNAFSVGGAMAGFSDSSDIAMDAARSRLATVTVIDGPGPANATRVMPSADVSSRLPIATEGVDMEVRGSR